MSKVVNMLDLDYAFRFLMMAQEWTKKKTAIKWLSRGAKASLLPEYGKCTQPWSRMRLAQVASGIKDVVDLTFGTSREFDRPAPHVLEAVYKAIADGAFDYPRSSTISELKQAIAERYAKRYGVEADPRSEVCITVGAAQGIDLTLRILVNPGDQVLMMDPDYGPYEPHVRTYQARVVPVPLMEQKPGKWRFDITELGKRVSKKTKLLMMSNANNPTGILYSKEDNEAIAELAQKYDFFVLADHVSEEIIFDGAKLHNIASVPGMKERTIVVSSFSKAHNLSGFRTGYAVANRDIVEHMSSMIGEVTDGYVTPGLWAALAALKGPQDWIREHVESLQKRRDMMVDRLNRMPGVVCGKPKGIYWAFPNIKGVGMPSHDLAEYLLTEGKVNMRPGMWYGRNGEGHLRVSFCANPEWIRKGMDRMEEAINKLKRLPLQS
jgi:aminotransferase